MSICGANWKGKEVKGSRIFGRMQPLSPKTCCFISTCSLHQLSNYLPNVWSRLEFVLNIEAENSQLQKISMPSLIPTPQRNVIGNPRGWGSQKPKISCGLKGGRVSSLAPTHREGMRVFWKNTIWIKKNMSIYWSVYLFFRQMLVYMCWEQHEH